jgi:hypothetical protein
MSELATIDDGFVPEPWPWVTWVELDGECVLYNATTGGVHVLSASGRVAWQMFDGTMSLGDAAAAIADALGVDGEVVRGDVTALVQRLAELGLLVGFEPAAIEPPAP